MIPLIRQTLNFQILKRVFTFAKIAGRRPFHSEARKAMEEEKFLLQLDVRNPLILEHTLPSGQSFRWKSISENVWRGVFRQWVITLEQKEPTKIQVACFPHAPRSDVESTLIDFFRLDDAILDDMYDTWSKPSSPTTSKSNTKDINLDFGMVASRLRGLRLMRQDPVECTFSFICSQNNNIKRISKMVESLCKEYGTLIGKVGEEEFHQFPTLEQLSTADEVKLRELGFGYRAKFIAASAKMILQNGGASWLNQLRNSDYNTCVQHLVKLPGVGPKVADCISLFSLDKLDVIPVDTHVRQIGARYIPCVGLSDNVQPKEREEITKFFRSKFGEKCGWAHTVMFTAELSSFSSSTPAKSTKKRTKESSKTTIKSELFDDEDFGPPKKKRKSEA